MPQTKAGPILATLQWPDLRTRTIRWSVLGRTQACHSHQSCTCVQTSRKTAPLQMLLRPCVKGLLPIWYSRFCRWSLWPTRTPGASQMKRGPCNVSCSSSGRWTSPTCCFAPGYSSFIAMLWWQLLMFRWFLFLCVVGTHLRIFIEPAKVIVVPTKALNTKQACS